MQQPLSLHMDNPGTLLKMAGYFLWDRRTERFSRGTGKDHTATRQKGNRKEKKKAGVVDDIDR